MVKQKTVQVWTKPATIKKIEQILLKFDKRQPYLNNTAHRIAWLVENELAQSTNHISKESE